MTNLAHPKYSYWQSPKDKQFYFHKTAHNGQVVSQSQSYADADNARDGCVADARAVLVQVADILPPDKRYFKEEEIRHALRIEKLTENQIKEKYKDFYAAEENKV